MSELDTTIKKRQQIEYTNRTVFIWVAGSAAIVGVALVLCVSLFQRLTFNQNVIGMKNQTVSTLKNNNQIVDKLRENVRVRNTSQALLDTPRLDGAEPISVVLDALPSQPNSSALGASLQKKLLRGVAIDTLVVNPTQGENGTEQGDSGTAKTIDFNFKVSAASNQVNNIKNILRKLEKSIRTINVTSMQIEQQSETISLTVTGVAYYSPETKVELTTKKVTPQSSQSASKRGTK